MSLKDLDREIQDLTAGGLLYRYVDDLMLEIAAMKAKINPLEERHRLVRAPIELRVLRALLAHKEQRLAKVQDLVQRVSDLRDQLSRINRSEVQSVAS